MLRCATIFWILLTLSLSSGAESFQGITYGDTLSSIQKKFPSANLSPVKAVWVTENDAFFMLDGLGFSGRLYITFDDPRPMWAGLAAQYRSSSDIAMAESFERRVKMSATSDVLTVRWLRWVPTNTIPAQRYILKYGKPDKLRFDENMAPYYAWEEKGVSVNLTDDEKNVLSVEFTFTRDEKYASCVGGDATMRFVCEKIYPKKK